METSLFTTRRSAVLKCRMDVQAADGESCLLQYTCTYASKFTDGDPVLRSTESTSFQVALSFLLGKEPGEPEMSQLYQM